MMAGPMGVAAGPGIGKAVGFLTESVLDLFGDAAEEAANVVIYKTAVSQSFDNLMEIFDFRACLSREVALVEGRKMGETDRLEDFDMHPSK